MIWFKEYTPEMLEGMRNSNMGTHIGIEFLELGPNFLKGTILPKKRQASASLTQC